MTTRIAVVAAVLALGIFALWHPIARTALVAEGSAGASAGPSSSPYAEKRSRVRDRQAASADESVVYVAGAVRSPGLYRLRSGDRAAKAVALAGGFGAAADAGGVNLAQHVADGDEIYVPVVGEALHPRSLQHHNHHRSHTPPPSGSVDVNRADPAELAAVPGIGHAVAARIVELRKREGSFASLDELLDVAGMTQTRLERARPYLHEP